jgi:cbb3-type cytochrome oxidase maturation protein
MDILLLLIPLSVGLALLVILALWWAVDSDQFEDLEQQGSKILHSD